MTDQFKFRRRGHAKPSLSHLTFGYGTPKELPNQFLQTLGKPHVDSFNSMLKTGLNALVKNLDPVSVEFPNEDVCTFFLSNIELKYPMSSGPLSKNIYPSECRQSRLTYKGHLVGIVNCVKNNGPPFKIEKDLGEIPIMIKSDRCHLSKLKPSELISRGEHEDEWGGYFVVSGNEKIIRLLLHTRRNFPVAVTRKSWKGKGQMFSDKGILLRCVGEDETSVNNTLHFVNDGTAKLMFIYRKSLYYVPICLILKCLLNVSDVYIFKSLIQGFEDNSYYKSCIRKMLHSLHIEGLDSHQLAKNFVGKTFRVRFPEQPKRISDSGVCDLILKRCVAIHLKDNADKFNLLVYMTQKLYCYVQEKCCTEGSDAVAFQEVLTGGSIYQQVLKDKLQGYLMSLRYDVMKKIDAGKLNTLNQLELAKLVKTGGVGTSMLNFMATGNINTRFVGGVPQENGLTVIAENINRMRYMSHFRAVHRGSSFLSMRTTEARALLPDAWGFICPVHTPDGTPCGLLNHLSKDCVVTDVPDEKLVDNLSKKLYDLGVVPVNNFMKIDNSLTVLLDGKVMGVVEQDSAQEMVNTLRFLKVIEKTIPDTTEIAYVRKKDMKSQFPGIYIFTGPGRLMRPVKNLILNKKELIGTFEQVYMDICIKASEAYPGRTTYQELSTTSFLSNLASLIPMPDCNQSPRNMYQCQMGKQSMGTPCHTWEIQAETKLYRLLFPNSPLFRPSHYDDIELDDFPMGINAVVAVISYTGYDMEDAMIINKFSYERGFGHGSILKSETIELDKGSYFERDPSQSKLNEFLDEDGLPYPGAQLKEEDPMYCYYNSEEFKYVVRSYRSKETAYIDSIRQFENEKGMKRAGINLRIPRNPTVGDKFASRAGQKGICSQLWPAENLPFTDSGMVPDIVFNPHGFPSRMTIAMMIELMAGKSAAVEGKVYDATPFQFSEKDTAIDYFGKTLESAGYSYYGTEKMYSGTDGREMPAHIFYGIVFYQRLRHMVLDKWQVRSTGPVDAVTQQPIQGRKRGGGIRFGEMERDALISHGASALINDRLFDCCDRFSALICRKCNCLLSAIVTKCGNSGEKIETCKKCPDGGDVSSIEIPYILRYLFVQLAAFNINIKVSLSN